MSFIVFIGTAGLVLLMGFSETTKAQSVPSPEPLPRAFEGIRQLKAPPVDIQNIRLLMTLGEVKAILSNTHLRFRKTEDTLAGIHLEGLHMTPDTTQMPAGFHVFSFIFCDGKLSTMLVDYDMNAVSLDFQAYFAYLKAQHGDPVEAEDIMKDAPAPLQTFKSFDYRWIDEQTEMKVSYTPPGGKDPLHRSMSGDVKWQVSDKQLIEKLRALNEARFKPRKELTEEERQKAIKQLLDRARQNEEEIQNQKNR